METLEDPLFTSNVDGYKKRYNTIEKINERLDWVRAKIKSLPQQRSQKLLTTKNEFDDYFALENYKEERDFLKKMRSALLADERKIKKRLYNKQATELKREKFIAFKQRQAEARQKNTTQE